MATGNHGLMMITAIDKLYHDKQISAASGIASVEPQKPFEIFVCNFSNKPRRIYRNQCVAYVPPCPKFVAESPVFLGEALGKTGYNTAKQD